MSCLQNLIDYYLFGASRWIPKLYIKIHIDNFHCVSALLSGSKIHRRITIFCMCHIFGQSLIIQRSFNNRNSYFYQCCFLLRPASSAWTGSSVAGKVYNKLQWIWITMRNDFSIKVSNGGVVSCFLFIFEWNPPVPPSRHLPPPLQFLHISYYASM